MKQAITHYERELLAGLAAAFRHLARAEAQLADLWCDLLLADGGSERKDAAAWLGQCGVESRPIAALLREMCEELGIAMHDPLVGEERP